MNDIRPPQRPRPNPTPAPQPPLEVTELPVIAPQPTELPTQPPKKKRIKRIILAIVATLLLLTGLGALWAWVWYQGELAPVDTANTELISIEIAVGESPNGIAAQLKEAGVIRNTTAFSIYTRLTDTRNLLQAGSYRLSPSESTPEIVTHLTNGKVDTFDITFLPGATLTDNKEVLREAGYADSEIDAAFATIPDRPLFKGAPASADLEGFIFGETYNIASSASVQEILNVTFDQFEKIIAENDIEAGFTEQGLSLYEGITLASIIQRESIGGDEPQIAQVFLLRREKGMTLGSDVTYQYIADKTGVPRDTNLDSPYNTRRYTGLPPGPISAPGVNSLKAVANPAEGDYLFFLSGDDDVTYFAKTIEEHEANIRDHCQVKCQII